VFPDVVRYLGVDYTDNKIGDRVYTSADGRVIYGRDLFGESDRRTRWGLVEDQCAL